MFIKKQPLPPRPLLITFDDAWSDSEEFVPDLVRKKQIKPFLFLTVSAINAHILSWEEALYSIWKGGLLSDGIIDELVEEFEFKTAIDKCDLKQESSIRLLIRQLSEIDASRLENVKQISYRIAQQLPGANQMLSREQLQNISKGAMDLGAHGMQHVALTKSTQPLQDLIDARRQLEKLVTLPFPVNTMSLPHSRYNKEILALTEKSGYKFFFGGKPILNRLSGCAAGSFFGRLLIGQSDLSDSKGRLQNELLALFLFRVRHDDPKF